MENTEIMNEVVEVVDDNVVTNATGLKTGTAMLIGAGVTAAAFAVVKLGKKAIAAIKAKKAKDEDEVYEEEIVTG